MKSDIKLKNGSQIVTTKEGFETIRRRIFDSTLFINMTDQKGRKHIINKHAIEWLREAGKRKEQNE